MHQLRFLYTAKYINVVIIPGFADQKCRCNVNHRWKTFIFVRVRPLEPINPIASLYASSTRQTLSGSPVGGYEPYQKMTRLEALKSYTINAAHGAFEEDIKGTIDIGKYADFTIFSQNIITVPDDQLLNTKIKYTIINGEIEYQAN